jgi:hypothetical protein
MSWATATSFHSVRGPQRRPHHRQGTGNFTEKASLSLGLEVEESCTVMSGYCVNSQMSWSEPHTFACETRYHPPHGQSSSPVRVRWQGRTQTLSDLFLNYKASVYWIDFLHALFDTSSLLLQSRLVRHHTTVYDGLNDWFDSTRLNSTQLNSTQLNSTPI